jgi:plastocyanin
MGAAIRYAAAVLAAAAVLGLAGCGARVKTIAVDTLGFGPAPADLHVGDVVEWDNPGILEHSATAENASFDVDLPAGGKGRTTLRSAGTIKYYCRFHPGMTGELKVSK